MPKFKYTAMDSKGAEAQGEVDADNQQAAIARIREKGLFPTGVSEVAVKAGKKAAPVPGAKSAGKKGLKKEIKLPTIYSRVKPKQLMVFTRQLATLVDAGLPLVRSLDVLARQERQPSLRRALSGMSESINTGSTFAEALSQHPKIFNKLYINMAKAGEVGGVLDVVLLSLADFMEKAQKIKNKVRGAMVYPIVVMFMAIGILIFMMLVIIPKFKEIFNDLLEGQSLPKLTEMVISVSNIVKHHFLWVIAAVVGIVIGIKALAKTRQGAYVLDQAKLKAPLFGELIRKTVIARFSRTLGTLMTSGVPVLQALNIVRDTAGNDVVARAVNSIHDAVKEGENMAGPIEATGVFPDMVVSMVQVGEETGQLPQMLMKIADNYEDEVDNAVAGITSIIEPLLIVFLAVIVGTIVIALFLPMITIIQKIQT